MKDSELQFDRTCHVLYSRPCKKEILAKIALHYPEAEREAVWEKVQRQYVEFLSDWRTDLGGKKNFHNGAGGTYDCIAILSYYAACRTVTSFREIEEMEENLILPSFRKLKFADCPAAEFANCADLDSAPPSERWQPRGRKAGAARRWRAALIYEKTLSIFQKTSPGGASQSKNALIG